MASLAVGLCVLMVASASTATDLARQWGQTHAYRYAWLVVPMLVYALGWHWRHAVLATCPRPCAAAIGVTAGAAVLWVAADLMNIDIGRQSALLMMVFGVVLAALGTEFIRRWAPALGLLVFLLPNADVLQPALRRATADGLYLTLQVLGLEVHREGLMLSVGANRYFVADGCSGLAYVTLLTFLGYAFGVLLYRSFWRVLALALTGGVLGVLSNLVRVNSIVLLDLWRGSQMDLTAHGYVQWTTLVLAIGLMLLLLARSDVEAMPSGARDPADREERRVRAPAWHRAAAPLAGVVGATITSLAVAAVSNGAEQSQALLRDVQPPDLGSWAVVGEASIPPVDRGGSSSHLIWRYIHGARQLQVEVVQAREQREKLSESVLAPSESEGWRDIQRQTLRTCSTNECIGFIHQIWQRSASTSLRHSYATFVVGDLMTASQLLLRARTGWAVLTGDAVHPRLIAITVDGEPISLQELHALFSAAARVRPISQARPVDSGARVAQP
jgi:exosortase